MARAENQLKTVQITLSTTGPMVKYLSALVSTGLYGKNPAEAAERLLAQTLEKLVHEGRVPGADTK